MHAGGKDVREPGNFVPRHPYAIEIEKTFCTDIAYTGKVCENGTVRIMKNDAVVHRRDILDGRK